MQQLSGSDGRGGIQAPAIHSPSPRVLASAWAARRLARREAGPARRELKITLGCLWALDGEENGEVVESGFVEEAEMLVGEEEEVVVVVVGRG